MLKQFFQHGGHTVALVEGEREMSYDVLREKVFGLADILSTMHMRVGGAFAIDMRDGIAWVIADLACIAANIPVVSIPSFFTREQRLYVLQKAGVTMSIAHGSAQREDDIALEIAGDVCHLVPTGFSPVSLPTMTAKITFTSGTTGQPKGVCLSAEGMLKKASLLLQAIGDDMVKRHRCVLPLAVLLENVGGVYISLLAGATAVLGSVEYTPQSLSKALLSSRASSCILVPELLKALVASGQRFPDLRYAAVGGAHVPKSLITKARESGIPVYEGYGLSEACSVVSLNAPDNDRIGSCGRLLDADSLSIAQDGEIILHSPAFLGYVGEASPAINFATGDLGRIDADGYLSVLGRKKNVIITSYGRNFSPEWVESLLLSQPGIRQAVVFGDGKPFNIAVLDTSGPMVASNAVRHVNAELPDYARIGAYILADEPFAVANHEITPTGKPNRPMIDAHYAQQMDSLYEEVPA